MSNDKQHSMYNVHLIGSIVSDLSIVLSNFNSAVSDSFRGYVLLGLTSHSTHCRSFRTRFYRSDDPTNSVIALKEF